MNDERGANTWTRHDSAPDSASLPHLPMITFESDMPVIEYNHQTRIVVSNRARAVYKFEGTFWLKGALHK